ncbi:hypothetical conserved protein [Candidatus Nitrosoglobus terrae]|uniref:Hypothetical conserved protein n=1 Tax=Candidatus Nitrosoglobus terrae TaxID=1630141 RepID=A0A1Q2SN59_9GAMM|nr:tetratricopeptide repeat protein [Candidatus Nitrosoglobus terrae]BAW80578.1 hypothetical conserved protein [Candidatus Nitrosoglobus terrae]
MLRYLSLSILLITLLILPTESQSRRVYDYYDRASQPSNLLTNVEGYHINLIYDGLRDKYYPKVENNIKFILDYFPNHPRALTILAQYTSEFHKYKFAEEYFGRALKLFPNTASTYGIYGFYLHRQGKLEEAIAQYRKAISLKEDYSEAYYNLGLALLDEGKAKEANKVAQKAYALNYPFLGLRKLLEKQGAWKPLKKSN